MIQLLVMMVFVLSAKNSSLRGDLILAALLAAAVIWSSDKMDFALVKAYSANIDT